MKKILIIAIISVTAMWSCRPSEKISVNGNDGDVHLGVITDMSVDEAQSGAPQAGTRGIVDGSSTFPFSSFTMWVEALGTNVAKPEYTITYVDNFYKGLGYQNISVGHIPLTSYVLGGDNNWQFTASGGTTYNVLGLFATRGDLKAYAVYPQNKDLLPFNGSVDVIPFDISTGSDYMINNPATPITIIPGNADASGNLNIPIRFKHVMTALEFQMKSMLAGTVVLDSVTYEVLQSDGVTRVGNAIGTKGTFDGRTGAVNTTASTGFYNMKYQSEIICPGRTNYGGFESWARSNYTSIALICPAITAVSGGKMICRFYFHYNNKVESGSTTQKTDSLYNYFGSKIEIPFSALGTPAGYVTNKKYVVRIQIDNFIKYSGYPVPEDWKDDLSTLPDIPF